MTFDLSVGQRVMIGFALTLFLFGGALLAVTRSYDASARAAHDFAQTIVPLWESAIQLERAVFQVGIDTRAYLLSPDDLNADTQRIAVARVRALEREVRAVSKDEAGEALYKAVLPLLEEYIATADKAMQQRRRGTFTLRPERELGDAREEAMSAIRAFSEHQSVRARAALANVTHARDRANSEARIGFGLAAALALGIALITAQSIRKPARELVDVARSFAARARPPALALPSRLSASTEGKARRRDELAQLARALQDSAGVIETSHERLRARARVAAAAACSLDKGEVADAALVVIAEHVRADAAVVYWRTGDSLRPIATYAMEEAAPVRVGDGVVGRAALSAQPVVSAPTDDDPLLRMKLGFADAPPKTLVAVPLRSPREVVGVLLIASAELIDQPRKAFLGSAGAQLSSGLRNALAYERLRQAAREAGCAVDAHDGADARRDVSSL